MLAYVTLRQQCSIAYQDYDDRIVSVEDWNVDVYTETGAESMKLRSGAVLCLDLLVKAQPL